MFNLPVFLVFPELPCGGSDSVAVRLSGGEVTMGQSPRKLVDLAVVSRATTVGSVVLDDAGGQRPEQRKLVPFLSL